MRGRIAFLLVCGLSGLGCDGPDLEISGTRVVLPEKYIRCTSGDSCTLTGASCSQCCEVEAVRASVEEEVYARVQRTCSEHDTPICSCQPMPRAAQCEAGRCTISPARTSCSLGDAPIEPGTSGIRDPFSCNDCVCQLDGTLACDEASCPRPCSAGMLPGVTCDSCGFNRDCDLLRTACLPACETSADCRGTFQGVCRDGVCKRVCGELLQ